MSPQGQRRVGGSSLSARVVVTTVLLATLPLATATWGVPGSLEPDTPRDRDEGKMWLDPDATLAGERVYFNAIATTGIGGNLGGVTTTLGGGVSPNLLGSALAPPGDLAIMAYLGVWKDCDQDGYVGAARAGLFAYRSELLEDTSVCPVGGAFNKNGWVWEFIWIAPGSAFPGDNPLRFIMDRNAGVWADIGLPESDPYFECKLTPLPRGTTTRTGGLVQAADCQTGFVVGQGLETVEGATGAPVGFDDPYHAERDCGHPLNRPVGLWRDPTRCEGEPHGLLEANTDDPTFTVWDCDRPKETADVRDPTAPEGQRGGLSYVEVRDPTDQRLVYNATFTDDEGTYMGPYGPVLSIPALAPSVSDDPTRASLNDAVNDTESGLMGCAPRIGYSEAAFRLASPSNWLEADRAGTAPTDGKRKADFPMVYQPDGFRGTISLAHPALTPVNAAFNGAKGDAPADLGLSYLDMARGSGWKSNSPGPAPPAYMGGTVRSDLAPAGPLWITAYAVVGANTTSRALVPGQDATYATEACGSERTGVLNGWDCDPANWWKVELGGARGPSGAYQPVPGSLYQLRDIDCLDGAVVPGAPAYASLVAASAEGPCPQV